MHVLHVISRCIRAILCALWQWCLLELMHFMFDTFFSFPVSLSVFHYQFIGIRISIAVWHFASVHPCDVYHTLEIAYDVGYITYVWFIPLKIWAFNAHHSLSTWSSLEMKISRILFVCAFHLVFFSFSFALVTCDFQIMAKSVEYRCSFEYLFNAMREIVDAQWHCTFVCLNNIHRWLDFKINIAMRKKGALILNAILAGSIDTHAVPSMHHCFDLFDII